MHVASVPFFHLAGICIVHPHLVVSLLGRYETVGSLTAKTSEEESVLAGFLGIFGACLITHWVYLNTGLFYWSFVERTSVKQE